MRRSTDPLYAGNLGPREREAYDLIVARPGITVGELRAAMGIGRARV